MIEYTGVLIILALAVLLTGGLMWVHLRLGPRREVPSKQEPFECGEAPLDSPRRRFAVKFFLVALLFVIFDVEVVFFYPWGAVFRELGLGGLLAMGIFTVPLVVALAYEWLKGALEW